MAFARTQYARAIQTLSKNLADSPLSRDVGNVAAVLFLFWCEIATEAMNGQAYAQHNEGLARLIFFALQQRRHTFLSQPPWKTIPWSQTWIPKTSMQKLLDIAADVPGLLEDADILERMPSPHGQESLQQRVSSTLQLLCQWHLEWQRQYPHAAVIAATPSRLHQRLLQVDSPTLPTSLWFHDFARAHEIAVYDAILLVLLGVAEDHVERAQIEEAITTADEGAAWDHSPLTLPHVGVTQQEVAEEVFRMVNYFLHGAHRTSGALAVYYALWAW
ncbi:hypothetical protein PRZ48_006798 [Zasmidium cellare]|uniref:Uncharacterized protein n=1 Tax=Zasmidium cellare TaxID=395010 RepID=A0ABR0EHK6_ZASCE|nr:hypothetical protein PRZ48_006798 [Zasmidium cellare]